MCDMFKKKKKYIHVLVFFIWFIYLNFEFQERSVSQCARVTPKAWISVHRWHFEHSAYVTPHDMWMCHSSELIHWKQKHKASLSALRPCSGAVQWWKGNWRTENFMKLFVTVVHEAKIDAYFGIFKYSWFSVFAAVPFSIYGASK